MPLTMSCLQPSTSPADTSIPSWPRPSNGAVADTATWNTSSFTGLAHVPVPCSPFRFSGSPQCAAFYSAKRRARSRNRNKTIGKLLYCKYLSMPGKMKSSGHVCSGAKCYPVCPIVMGSERYPLTHRP